MIHFLIYIIKSTLCLTLFYLFFKALLSRETFFRFNRFLLLAGMIVCALLPIIEIKTSQATVIQEPIAKIESLLITPKPSDKEIIPDNYLFTKSETGILEYPKYLESFEITGETPVSSSPSPISMVHIVEIIYGTGFLITLFLLFISVYKMIRIIRKGKKIKKGKYTVVCIPWQICPFSWGKYLVLSENDYLQNPDEILTHEEVHARKQHSLDLLFSELFILFHWFNPVAWLLKGELQDIHEYEADRGVINQGVNATKYQLMLVKKAVGARSYAIANSFNHSKIKIKNRITMMLKRKSTQWARFKLLLFAPLAVVLLQAFARPESVRIQESLIDSEGTTIFQQSQQWTKSYFDGKVDEYVQKMEGKTKDSIIWPSINVKLDDEICTFTILPTQEATRLFCSSEKFPKTDEKIRKMLNSIINHLKDVEKNRIGKNLYSPSIVYLIVENSSDSCVQLMFDTLGELNEEFIKAREEQKLKDKNAKFTEKYSDVPVYVVINERIKYFDYIDLAMNNKNNQSSGQQKSKSILQDEFDKPKESYGKSNSVIIENVSDSTKKLILNGTMIMAAGEKKYTISGDSVEIIIN